MDRRRRVDRGRQRIHRFGGCYSDLGEAAPVERREHAVSRFHVIDTLAGFPDDPDDFGTRYEWPRRLHLIFPGDHQAVRKAQTGVFHGDANPARGENGFGDLLQAQVLEVAPLPAYQRAHAASGRCNRKRYARDRSAPEGASRQEVVLQAGVDRRRPDSGRQATGIPFRRSESAPCSPSPGRAQRVARLRDVGARRAPLALERCASTYPSSAEMAVAAWTTSGMHRRTSAASIR